MIVLCGSSLSFIEKELLSEKNPLYGRATGILKIQELGFYDSVRFFPDYSALDKVLAYSVVGGIPHYLKQFDPEAYQHAYPIYGSFEHHFNRPTFADPRDNPKTIRISPISSGIYSLGSRQMGKSSHCATELYDESQRNSRAMAYNTSYETELLAEHVVDIYVNDVLRKSLICTPLHLAELVTGRLVSEGVVKSPDDIVEIRLAEDGSIRALLSDSAHRSKEPSALAAHDWSADDVFLCADHFRADTPLHQRTRSTHSCFLLAGGKILLTSAALFISGRVPSDMVIKAVRSRVPVLMSKETATIQAIRAAEKFGLTLIGKVRPESFVVYTGNTVENE